MKPTTNTNGATPTQVADSTAEVRIYVGTFGKYAGGSIKGAWLDLSQYADRDDFLAACVELHFDESDPELMFQDFEGFPRAWYEESEAPPAILWEWMGMSEDDKEAFGLYADNMGGTVTVEQFRDCYQGTDSSEAEFAETLAEETESIPKSLPSWIVIDWQRSWNSGLRFDFWAERGETGNLHFFRND